MSLYRNRNHPKLKLGKLQTILLVILIFSSLLSIHCCNLTPCSAAI